MRALCKTGNIHLADGETENIFSIYLNEEKLFQLLFLTQMLVFDKNPNQCES